MALDAAASHAAFYAALAGTGCGQVSGRTRGRETLTVVAGEVGLLAVGAGAVCLFLLWAVSVLARGVGGRVAALVRGGRAPALGGWERAALWEDGEELLVHGIWGRRGVWGHGTGEYI